VAFSCSRCLSLDRLLFHAVKVAVQTGTAYCQMRMTMRVLRRCLVDMSHRVLQKHGATK